MGGGWSGGAWIPVGLLRMRFSHGGLWLLAAAWRLQSSYGYGLVEVKIPAEKMCLIAAYGVRDARPCRVALSVIDTGASGSGAVGAGDWAAGSAGAGAGSGAA